MYSYMVSQMQENPNLVFKYLNYLPKDDLQIIAKYLIEKAVRTLTILYKGLCFFLI